MSAVWHMVLSSLPSDPFGAVVFVIIAGLAFVHAAVVVVALAVLAREAARDFPWYW